MAQLPNSKKGFERSIQRCLYTTCSVKPQRPFKLQLTEAHLAEQALRISLSQCHPQCLSRLMTEKSQGNRLLFKARGYFPAGNLLHSPAAEFDEVSARAASGDRRCRMWNSEHTVEHLREEEDVYCGTQKEEGVYACSLKESRETAGHQSIPTLTLHQYYITAFLWKIKATKVPQSTV